jgi:predicted transcriptional regulator of viral defense system
MKQLDAIKVLKVWDKKGRYIFTKHILAKLFSEDNKKAFEEGLSRLVKTGILERVCRGVYVNKEAASLDQYTIERIVQALRPKAYNYVSLESALSEYGVISQIPMDRLTVMTTGRESIYKTPYGVIEMTHTKRAVDDILKNTIVIKERPLRIATKKAALRDLKRVGRNLNLIDEQELDND